mgnify:CR=1 FL=1
MAARGRLRHSEDVVIAVMHPQDDEHDEPWRELVVVGVPGDRTVDMKRLEAQFTPAEIEEATDEDLKKHPELVKGYIGPMALGPQARDGKKAENASETGDALRYLIDAHVARGSAWFTGADEQDVDYYDWCTAAISRPTAPSKPCRYVMAT